MNIGVPLKGVPTLCMKGHSNPSSTGAIEKVDSSADGCRSYPAWFPSCGASQFLQPPPPSAGSYEILLHSQVRFSPAVGAASTIKVLYDGRTDGAA